MFGSTVSQAGIRDADVNIDGTAIVVPLTVSIQNPPLYAAFQTMLNLPIIQIPYWGDGLPNQPDAFQFGLNWELSDDSADQVAALSFLEGLRTAGGTHTFVLWKQFRYTYTLRAGQTVLYLPRPDAYSKSYAGKTGSQYKAAIKRGAVGGTLSGVTVQYKSSVTAATAVDAGEAWISNAASVHPDSGKNVALFKLGTAPVAPETLTVDFHPLFNVFPTSVLTQPFTRPGREDKDLYLIEVN